MFFLMFFFCNLCVVLFFCLICSNVLFYCFTFFLLFFLQILYYILCLHCIPFSLGLINCFSFIYTYNSACLLCQCYYICLLYKIKFKSLSPFSLSVCLSLSLTHKTLIFSRSFDNLLYHFFSLCVFCFFFIFQLLCFIIGFCFWCLFL